jgi:hypothetical protein
MTYSRDGFPFSLNPAGKSLIGAPINQGVPVLDQDVNLMHRIHLENSKNTHNFLYKCGWLRRGTFTNFGVNVFEMLTSDVICDGLLSVIAGTNAITNTFNVDTTVGRPAGQTFDILFVEIWDEEVDETGTIFQFGNVDHYDPGFFTNDVIDPAVGAPAATRMQRRYRVRSVAEASTMTDFNVTVQGKKATPEPTGDPLRQFVFQTAFNNFSNNSLNFGSIGDSDDLDGQIIAFPIALIERTVGDDDLTNATITDLRVAIEHKVSQFAPPADFGSGCEAYTFNGQIVSFEIIDVVVADAVTIDFCDGNVHFVDLAPATGDVTVTLDNPVPGGVYYISFKQHPTTPVQLIWPGDVDFVLGFPALLSLVGGDVDVFQLIRTSNPSFRVFPMGSRTLSAAPPCQQDLTAVTDPFDIDFSICDSWRVFLDPSLPASLIGVNLLNGEAGGAYSIKFVQPSAGATKNYAITNPSQLLAPAGFSDNFPYGRPSNTNGGIDIFTLYFDGTTYCYDMTGAHQNEAVRFNSFGAFPGPSELFGTIAYHTDVVPNPLYFSIGTAWRQMSMADDPSSSPVSVIDDLLDVTTAGVVDGQLLQFDGVNWVGGISKFLLDTAVQFGANVGTGDGLVFRNKTGGVGAGTLNFRRLLESSGINITTSGDNITFANTGVLSVGGGSGISSSGGQNPSITNTGVLAVNNKGGSGEIIASPSGAGTPVLKRIRAGTDISVTSDANGIIITNTAGGGGGVGIVNISDAIFTTPNDTFTGTTGVDVISISGLPAAVRRRIDLRFTVSNDGGGVGSNFIIELRTATAGLHITSFSGAGSVIVTVPEGGTTFFSGHYSYYWLDTSPGSTYVLRFDGTGDSLTTMTVTLAKMIITSYNA